MSRYVGAIDQGTTSTRFILFDADGNIVSVGQKEHQQIFPQPGWVEHDASEIWTNTRKVINQAMEKNGIDSEDIAVIGMTNQRETTVLWDRNTGEPLSNAIVWQDTRTDKLCEQIGGEFGPDRFRDKTGLPLATYFSGPKIKWLIDSDPEIKKAVENRTAMFGNMDTWVIWNITGGPRGGVHITDPTNASRTLLMNLETLDWDEEILKVMDIPRSILPDIKPSSDVYGLTTEDGPFKHKIPVGGDLGDQQAALVGQTCFETGEAKNTYGTGCFMLLNTGNKFVQSRNGLLTTVAYKFGREKPAYALEGSIAIAGALVQWLRDNLGIIEESPQIEELAKTVEDNGGVYFVPAFSGLFAPYWKSNARGVIAGLTRFANKGHIARAALEATAYQTREVMDAMHKDSGVSLKLMKVDGGMVVNELLMQFQADVLGVPVVRPKVTETTALGAAYAAGLAVGFWKSREELKKNWSVDKQWNALIDDQERKKGYSKWKKAVTRTFDWLEKE